MSVCVNRRRRERRKKGGRERGREEKRERENWILHPSAHESSHYVK